MNRSVEMPSADDPVAEDPLLAELRTARPAAPVELLDPSTPAHQVLLEAVLDGTATADDPAAASAAPRRRIHAARLARAAAVAAIVAVVAGLVVVWPFGSTEPSAADVVRRAVVASEAALDSGRATLTVTTTGDFGGGEDTYEYRFAGDDVGVEIALGAGDGEAYPGERRIVDGQMYWHVGDDPSAPWFHQTGAGTFRSDWTADPRTLLAGMEARAGFEIVGDDTVDGAAVTHLRATTPDDISPSELGLGTMNGGTLTGLDVWVDDDDVVRRIDVAIEQTFDAMVGSGEGDLEPQTLTHSSTASVRFHDIGVPNVIEAPTHVCDVSPEQMANPPPPGADVC